MFRVALLALALVGCDGSIQYSPFQTDVPEEHRDGTARALSELASQGREAFAPFRFAVISDTHAFYDELADAVEVINRRDDLAFVLVTGDLTDTALLREFVWTDEILSRLRIPYLTVIGAHEGITNGPEIYGKMFGAENYGFVYNDVKFVMANTNSWEFDNRVPDFPWIEQALSDGYLYTHLIFASHIGPFDGRFGAETRDRYNQLLTDYGVKLSIHGHELSPRDLGVSPAGVHFVVVGGIDLRTFLVVDVRSDAVDVARVWY